MTAANTVALNALAIVQGPAAVADVVAKRGFQSITQLVNSRVAWKEECAYAAFAFHDYMSRNLPRWARIRRAWHRMLARRWYARFRAMSRG